MHRKVDPRIYAPMPAYEVERQLRQGVMPEPFIRRMRLINLLSASTLRKIEDDLFLPWDVMGIHHMLDELISQDAIIDTIETPELRETLISGNVYPLWDIAPANPLLFRAFHQGWIHRFFQTPFDPLCIMLAMRCRLLLDLIDELGHSYNLIRGLGYGFIDFGDIPGEEPGDPGDYIPPGTDTPIDYPDVPQPPGDAPGQPDYVPPGPGEPGYTEPPPPPPAGYGAIGAPMGLGSSPGDLGGAASPGGSTQPPPFTPCADKDDPEQTVSFSYTTQGMAVDETQDFSVTGNHPRYSYENYVWKISGGGGSLTRSGADPPDPIYGPEEPEYDPEAVMRGFDVTYTAPPDNAECAKNPTIELWCGGDLMASLDIAVNAYTPEAVAYYKKTTCSVIRSLGQCHCRCGGIWPFADNRYKNMSCDGSFIVLSDTYTCNDSYYWGCDAEEAEVPCTSSECPEVVDHRHPLEITGGCCPEELL